MSGHRVSPSTTDYLTIALSPALVMTMVGSLVFFLLEVFYSGPYEGRIRWVMIWFVLATVLIARISMIDGAQHAGLYGAALAVVTALVLLRFVDAVLLAWLLMIVTWCCAHLLTWDCTHLDESEDAPGEGLLQSAGLDDSGWDQDHGPPTDSAVAEVTEFPAGEDRPPSTWKILPAALAQSLRLRPSEERSRVPGVWIVYFSLAALPLFGLGQLLIPVAETARRQYAFVLLCVYLASGLGLLLSTTFLGLRRYLRGRRLEMPLLMTGVWLSIGAASAAVVLLLAALLPRPQAEYAISSMTGLTGSREYEASRMAMLRDSPARGGGRASNRTSEDPSAEHSLDGQSESSGGQNSRRDQSGDERHSEGQGDSNNDAKQQDDTARDREEAGEDTDSDDTDAEQDEREEEDRDSGQQGRADQREQGGSRSSSQSDNRGSTQSPIRPSPKYMPSPGGAILLLMKWLLYAVLVAAGLYFLWHHWRDVIAWMRQLIEVIGTFWQRLLGGRSGPTSEEAETEQQTIARPFSRFSDPFADGTADSRSVDELVRYSFDALQAWADERGSARRADETPIEFCRRVAASFPGPSADVRKLGALYAGFTYGRISPAASSRDTLRRLWREMMASFVATAVPADAVTKD